jgi:hypothetical protein
MIVRSSGLSAATAPASGRVLASGPLVTILRSMEAPLRFRMLRVWLAAALWMLALPSVALGAAQVQFLHAVPGVGKASVSADGRTIGTAAFGQVSSPATVPSGSTKLVLTAPGGVTLKNSARLANGATYTIVGLARGKAAAIHLYRDGGAKPGRARLRMVQAAPELGDADLALNGRVVAGSVPYRAATRYWTLPPGNEQLAVQHPGSSEMALGSASLPLSAGTASTAYVVGSKGERVRVVLVDDATTAPSAAPQTGLGGLVEDDGGFRNWGTVIAAALVAALVAIALRRRASG